MSLLESALVEEEISEEQIIKALKNKRVRRKFREYTGWTEEKIEKWIKLMEKKQK